MKVPISRRVFKRIVASVSLLVIGAVVWGWVFAWRRLPYYRPTSVVELPVPLMTDEGYDEVFQTHERPFIVELPNGPGKLILYGATHTKNPEDPQLADIESRWNRLQPTVALCESRLGILFPGLMTPVKEFSEPGYVHQLARESGIPTYTWEPPNEVIMDHLFSLPFSKEQIALRVKLGPYFSNRRYGRPTSPEAFVADYLGNEERWPGLETVLVSIAEIAEAWKRHFPSGPDWRDVSDETDLPGFLKSISTNAARDEHFIRVLIELIEQGERVFAVAGFSHAVKLEPALEGYFQE